jgi:hypothetical protein
MTGDAKIVVSGKGRISADVVAVGSNAKAEKTVHTVGSAPSAQDIQNLHEKLDALITLVKMHRERLPDREAAEQLTERLGTELERDKPDKLTLKSLLAAIAEEAKPVVEIVGAVASLKSLIFQLF